MQRILPSPIATTPPALIGSTAVKFPSLFAYSDCTWSWSGVVGGGEGEGEGEERAAILEAIGEAGRKARRQERAIKTESRKHICLHFGRR